MTPIAVEQKFSAGKHRSFPGKCPAQPRKCRPGVNTCIESREASVVCPLQMPSPLSRPCRDTLGPLSHLPRMRVNESQGWASWDTASCGTGSRFLHEAWIWLGEGTQGPSPEGVGFSKLFETQTWLFSPSPSLSLPLSLSVNPIYSPAGVPC